MRHLFDRPLGASIAPHGSLFKFAYDPTSLISAGLNFAGTMATNQINAERAASDMATYLNLVRKQRDWQKEDQQWTEDYTKRLMDYQNQYNTPSAQMKRFKEAGLNPYALMNNEGAIGSGLSQSVPSANPSAHGSVTPFQRPVLDNPMSSAADKLFNASALHSQRIGALSSFSKALPDLVKSVGKDGAKRIAESVLGNSNINMDRIDNLISSEVAYQSYETNVAKIKSDVAQATSMQYASNLVALQEQEFAKWTAQSNLMYTESELNKSNVDVNRAKIRVAASEYVRNFADALHLKKVGDYYEASATTINALRSLTKESLQLRVNSMRRNDISEQVVFEAQRGLREHISSEGEKLNDRFIQNWDIETDPFYNEVSKILNSWHISTNVGFSGSYGSKDVYGHGFGY